MSFLFSKKPHLGIDLSDTDVRFVQLRDNNSISSSAVAPLPSHAFDKEQILDAAAIAKVIQETLATHKDWSHDVAFCIPDTQCFVYHITAEPGLTGEPLHDAVLGEAAKIVPVVQADLVYDFIKKDDTHYLYVAALKTTVSTYQEVARLAGLNLTVLDCDGLAFGRAFLTATAHTPAKTTGNMSVANSENTGVNTAQQATLVVSIGDEVASITIFDSANQLLVSSTAPYAAGRFAKSIVTSLRVMGTQKSATIPEIKLVPETPTVTGSNTDSETVLQTALKAIVDEVLKAFAYVSSTYSLTVERVILAGELAIIPGIEDYFTRFLKISVVVGNPVQNLANNQDSMKVFGGESPVLFAGAIGMSLWKEGINLHKEPSKSIFPFSRNASAGATDQAATQSSLNQARETEGPNSDVTTKKPDSLVKKIAGAFFVIAAFGGLGYVLYEYLIKPLMGK